MTDKRRLASALAEVGQAFASLRRDSGWTQTALARRSGVSRDTIHRFERGGPIELVSLLAMLTAMGQRVTFAARHELRAADMRRKFAHLHEERE